MDSSPTNQPCSKNIMTSISSDATYSSTNTTTTIRSSTNMITSILTIGHHVTRQNKIPTHTPIISETKTISHHTHPEDTLKIYYHLHTLKQRRHQKLQINHPQQLQNPTQNTPQLHPPTKQLHHPNTYHSPFTSYPIALTTSLI